nr:uncharacterized protein LOC119714702 isoform X2 [Anas platyrhynchos]
MASAGLLSSSGKKASTGVLSTASKLSSAGRLLHLEDQVSCQASLGCLGGMPPSSSPSEAASGVGEFSGMPPRQPRLAWQETWSSEGSNRPAEDSLLAEDSTPVEDILPAEDRSPAEDSLLSKGSSPVEDSSLAEDRRPAEDSLVVENRGLTEDSKKELQLLDPTSTTAWKRQMECSCTWLDAWQGGGQEEFQH